MIKAQDYGSRWPEPEQDLPWGLESVVGSDGTHGSWRLPPEVEGRPVKAVRSTRDNEQTA
jgi:hypothetical protein